MIIIAPYAKKLQNGKNNPKNYPWFKELVELIQTTNELIVQVGVDGEEQLVPDFRKNLPFIELRQLIKDCRTFVGVDSFFQHLAWEESKPGIVLWSVSDPLIFGHLEHTNLLKDRANLATNQFLWWDFVEHNNDAFVKPKEVFKHLQNKHDKTQ